MRKQRKNIGEEERSEWHRKPGKIEYKNGQKCWKRMWKETESEELSAPPSCLDAGRTQETNKDSQSLIRSRHRLPNLSLLYKVALHEGSSFKDLQLFLRDERGYKCPDCGKYFIKRKGLSRHFRVHTGIRPFKCELCEKSFGCKGTLKRHQIVHTNVRTEQCPICQKTFRNKGGLKIHSFIHTGELPYKCSICPQAFRQMSGLNTHLIHHSGEKKHMCEECGKLFAQRENLKVHKLKHSGEKPFKYIITVKVPKTSNLYLFSLFTHSAESCTEPDAPLEGVKTENHSPLGTPFSLKPTNQLIAPLRLSAHASHVSRRLSKLPLPLIAGFSVSGPSVLYIHWCTGLKYSISLLHQPRNLAYTAVQ
uniref:C2H2-type domain-containing protein n=1 Tax=Timema bartmani TaxID=61472 RepID=A0A7R9I151_9NEOP|nr:unnamed protein product [Timema bartmani]